MTGRKAAVAPLDETEWGAHLERVRRSGALLSSARRRWEAEERYLTAVYADAINEVLAAGVPIEAVAKDMGVNVTTVNRLRRRRTRGIGCG